MRTRKMTTQVINTRSSTLAIHLVDSTTLIYPGPVTEHDSTISEVGRFVTMAYVEKKTDQNENLLQEIQQTKATKFGKKSQKQNKPVQ